MSAGEKTENLIPPTVFTAFSNANLLAPPSDFLLQCESRGYVKTHHLLE